MLASTKREHSEEGWTRLASGDGVVLRPMSSVDLGGVRELRGVVRWSADPRAFDLLRGMREARWAVAEAPGGALAGMVGAVPLGEVGILCHLAVREGHRRSGLGAALSRWAVCYLRSRGARLVRLDSTRRAEGLYRALGFAPAFRRVTYRLDGPARAWTAREAAADHEVRALTVGDLPELLGLDHWSYGADRSSLVLATLRLHSGGGLVARDGAGRIKGYLLRSASGSGRSGRGRVTRLGPFAAASPGVAGLLLGGALAGNGGGPVEATVPGPDGPGGSPAHALYAEHGFTGRDERLRMELGEAPDPGGLVHYGTTPYLAT